MQGESRCEILGAFEKAEAIFFRKTMTASMVTKRFVLEFPVHFVEDHGDKFTEKVALVIRRDNCGSVHTVWRVTLTLKHSAHWKSRVLAAYNGGWKKFVLENRIKTGDILVFELVDFSRFFVHVCSAPQFDITSIGKLPEFPRFVATMSASHAGVKGSGRLIIPTEIWRFVGKGMFDHKLFKLEGPIMPRMYVKAYVEVLLRQTKCCFRGGWKRFFTANKLQIGDRLVLSLTGPYCFAVTRCYYV